MIAAATAGTALVLACVILGLIVVIAWGAAESDHDRVERHRHRTLLHEIRGHQLEDDDRQPYDAIDRERRQLEEER